MKERNMAVLFVQRCPREVRDRFKAWCAANGVTMMAAVTELIREASRDGSKLVSSKMLETMREPVKEGA